MICWSCQREAGDGPLCAACSAVQPPRPQASCFEVLGLPKSYFVEPSALEERFKERSRKLHPDRFAQKTARERRLSLEWTTAVNDAYRTLRDPLRRALYLVKGWGLDIEKETGAAAMRRLPPEFLDEVMDLREVLAEARSRKDLAKVESLAASIESRQSALLEELAGSLRALEAAGGQADLGKAGRELAMLKYLQRLGEDIEAIQMAALE